MYYNHLKLIQKQILENQNKKQISNFLLVFLECLFEAWKECVQIINLFGSFSSINKPAVRMISILLIRNQRNSHHQQEKKLSKKAWKAQPMNQIQCHNKYFDNIDIFVMCSLRCIPFLVSDKLFCGPLVLFKSKTLQYDRGLKWIEYLRVGNFEIFKIGFNLISYENSIDYKTLVSILVNYFFKWCIRDFDSLVLG